MRAPRGVFALLVPLMVASAAISATLPPGLAAADPAWPASGGLVLAEVMTGGVSASDEYVEIANAGATNADLGGCELIYVTATGATTTRKASFTSPLLLVPGQHLLVANAAGIYGPLADATYSGGLAADGGAVALRRLDGTVLDAVGWGTAANSYVEATAAPAPPAKSSIERLPGGSSGNTRDSNDNRADWFVQPNPIPQSLASTPVPGPSATPSATAVATVTMSPGPTPTDTATSAPTYVAPSPPVPTATPQPSLASEPTETPLATATSEPTDSPQPTETPATTDTPEATDTPETTDAPTPTASPIPTPTATPTPAPTAKASATPTASPTTSSTPTATPTPTSTRSPSPSPSPSRSATSSPSPTARPSTSPSPTEQALDLEMIAAARAQPPGARVHVAGVVTVGPGLVGADDLFAIQDSSGGIFVRLSPPEDGLAIGCSVEVEGTLAAPYGQLEIRDTTSLTVGDDDTELSGARAELTDVGEQTEGSLVTIRGAVDSVQTDSGRLTIMVGDGTTAVRVLADPPAGLSKADVAKGDVVLVTGIVGQHATATGRLDGYRVWLRRRADLVIRAPIETEAPDPTSAPTSAPTGTPVYGNLSAALGTRGAAVDVEATVTATAGLLDIGNPTVVVDDGTAAVAVILPAAADAPRVGMRVRVTGKIGSWEGGPTVIASQVAAQGILQAIDPRPTAGPLDSSLEWQLVQVCGRIDRFVPAGARWRADMLVDGHTVTVLGEPSVAIALTKSSVGRLAVVVGIVRRSTSDSSVFQMIPRTSLDFRLGPSPEALGATAGLGSAGPSGGSPVSSGSAVGAATTSVGIGSLSAYIGRTVTVAGLVTKTASGTATIDDGTGEVRVGGSAAADALAMLEPGDAIEVTGLLEQDEGGLIIKADPLSVVDLPGDRGEATTTPGDLVDLAAGVSAAVTAPSTAAAATIQRVSPATAPANGVALLALILVAIGAVAAALAFARRGGSLRRLAVPVSPLAAVLLARLDPRRPKPGPRRGK